MVFLTWELDFVCMVMGRPYMDCHSSLFAKPLPQPALTNYTTAGSPKISYRSAQKWTVGIK